MGHILERLFFSTWWVVALFVLSLSLFERGMYKINQDQLLLDNSISILQGEIAESALMAAKKRERLASFEDPVWIELLLIKNLGLIPEGFHKYVLIESGS